MHGRMCRNREVIRAGRRARVMLIAILLCCPVLVLAAGAANTTPNATVSQTTAVTTTAIPNQTTVTTTTIAANQTTVAATTTPAGNQTTTVPTTTANRTTVTTIRTTAPVTTPVTTLTSATPTIPATTAITTGSVVVYSSPTGASILIDGIYQGTTPATIDDLPAGTHILRLTLSGYSDYEGSIYIVPGQVAQGYGTLQPLSLTGQPTPAPTVVVIVTVTPQPTQDTGTSSSTAIVVAVLGAIGVIVAAVVSVFTHITPPKKE